MAPKISFHVLGWQSLTCWGKQYIRPNMRPDFFRQDSIFIAPTMAWPSTSYNLNLQRLGSEAGNVFRFVNVTQNPNTVPSFWAT